MHRDLGVRAWRGEQVVRGQVYCLNLHLTPAEEANEYPTVMYRSAPRTITPQERRELSLALTGPVPTEVRENCIISWPLVGVLLSCPSPVQLIKGARVAVSHCSRQHTGLTEDQWHVYSR
ncbi:hypothetical protein DHA2_152397 [Giardia duodenalis]|uniref:Uncharacterized protein n=1 Tax=Giardia intestinalis TaxID=5741 RepID=V6TBP9_GIAIN|nr:hypothetical protein DHA2_152397 [Giardia intestinalis]